MANAKQSEDGMASAFAVGSAQLATLIPPTDYRIRQIPQSHQKYRLAPGGAH
jgi:hypothetical protein